MLTKTISNTEENRRILAKEYLDTLSAADIRALTKECWRKQLECLSTDGLCEEIRRLYTTNRYTDTYLSKYSDSSLRTFIVDRYTYNKKKAPEVSLKDTLIEDLKDPKKFKETVSAVVWDVF